MLIYTTQEAADEACRLEGYDRWFTDGERYYLPETAEEFDELVMARPSLTIREEAVEPA